MYTPAQPVQYPNETPTKIKKGLNLKPVFIIFVTFILYIVTIVIGSLLSNFSENIEQIGIATSFNPIITIAYILVFYCVSHYYSLTRSQAYNYLLLTLFLSFTINFVEGCMILVFLAPILHKLKLIETQTT